MRFILVIDTPDIKQFVFGTDTLAEVRGASALLDHLNRKEMKRRLEHALNRQGCVDEVFANGGTGQFILDCESRETAEQAVKDLAAYCREETGGEVRIVWGLVPYAEGSASRSICAGFGNRASQECQGRWAAGFQCGGQPMFWFHRWPPHSTRRPWGRDGRRGAPAVRPRRHGITVAAWIGRTDGDPRLRCATVGRIANPSYNYGANGRHECGGTA